MATLKRKTKAVIKTYYPVPWVLRIADSIGDIKEKSSINSQRYYPVSLKYRPGPDGSQLTIRTNYYAFSSTPADRAPEDLVNKMVALEIRHNSGRNTLQEVLFIGRITEVNYEFTGTNDNGISLVCSDYFTELSDNPLMYSSDDSGTNMIIRPKWTVGENLAQLSAGFWNYLYWDRGTSEWVEKTMWFNPPLFPRDGNGNKLLSFSPDLFTLKNRVDPSFSFKGQGLSAVIAELLDSANLVPVIRFNQFNQKFVIEGKRTEGETLKKGKTKRLVVGKIGNDCLNVIQKYEPNVVDFTGTSSYAGLVNRVIGLGGPIRSPSVADLTPAWSAEEELMWLYDVGYARSKSGYWHVGRLYKLNKNIHHKSAGSRSLSGYNTTLQDVNTNTSILWEKNSDVEVGFRFSQASYKLHYFKTTNKFQEGVMDEIYKHSRPSDNDGNFGYVLFDYPQIVEYYTLLQRENMEAGNSETPTLGFKQFQLQALEEKGQLSVDTGVLGDFPRVRTKIHENKSYTKTTTGTMYGVALNTNTPIASEENVEVDNTNDLLNESLEILEESYQPTRAISCTLATLDFSWELYDIVDTIIDIEGNIIYSGIRFIVKEIDHDFKTYRTSLSFANIVRSL